MPNPAPVSYMRQARSNPSGWIGSQAKASRPAIAKAKATLSAPFLKEAGR